VTRNLVIWFAGLCILAGTTFDFVVVSQIVKIRTSSINLSTAEICIAAFLLIAMARSWRGFLPCLTRHRIPLILILGLWLSGVTTAFLTDQTLASLKFSLRYLAIFLVFVSFLCLGMSGELKIFEKMVAVWGIFLGILGLLEFLSPGAKEFLLTRFLPTREIDARVGTVLHPNLYGAFMGLVFLLGLVSLSREKSWLSLSTTSLGLVGVSIAGSRNAWLITSICLVIYALTRRHWREFFRVAVAAFVVLGAVIALYVGGSLWSARAPILSDDRIVIWRAALAAWRTSPLIGIGPGIFRLRLHEFVTPDKKVAFEERAGEFNAHNVFLGILVEQGLVGFWLLVTLVAWLLWRLIGDIGEIDEVLLLAAVSLPLLLDDFLYSYLYATVLAVFLALALGEREGRDQILKRSLS